MPSLDKLVTNAVEGWLREMLPTGEEERARFRERARCGIASWGVIDGALNAWCKAMGIRSGWSPQPDMPYLATSLSYLLPEEGFYAWSSKPPPRPEPPGVVEADRLLADTRELEAWGLEPESSGMVIHMPTDWDLVELVLQHRAGRCLHHEDCREHHELGRACLAEATQSAPGSGWPSRLPWPTHAERSARDAAARLGEIARRNPRLALALTDGRVTSGFPGCPRTLKVRFSGGG